jgi:hypothetical protein
MAIVLVNTPGVGDCVGGHLVGDALVGDFVGALVGDFVGALVGDFVGGVSVGDFEGGASVGDAVGNSVRVRVSAKTDIDPENTPNSSTNVAKTSELVFTFVPVAVRS